MKTDETLYLIKLGEISLKGENRNFFEKILRRNIKRKLKGFSSRIETQKGRMFLFISGCPDEKVEHVLSTTFGIHGFSRAVSVKKDMDTIAESILKLLEEQGFSGSDSAEKHTFKIEARRADKSFPLSSYQICCELGGSVLDSHKNFSVDVHKPDLRISVEIRHKAFLYLSHNSGIGGLPVGCAGKGLLLLSGGIDSPVAGYRMAKRGLRLDALYFHTYPYTSDEALQKVVTLGDKLSVYATGLRLFTVPFTDVQLEINKKAKSEEHTLLMRYAMVRIANMIAGKTYAKALVTGEALSQVASQTLESISLTDSASERVIFRPLIGLDKEEIIRTAKKIDTYETSILPYEDCCTIFSPTHPLTRPDKTRLTESFKSLQLDDLMVEAAEKTMENITFYAISK